MEISTFDLLTEKEAEIFQKIKDIYTQINESEGDRKKELIEQKKGLYEKFDAEIEKHNGTPRCVNLNSVTKTGPSHPAAVTWRRLKPTKQIAEFLSEQTRSMGLSDLDITYDKIIVKWKNLEILKQIILDGFTMDIFLRDGTTATKRYRFYTASAGQLRTDKVQFISEEMYDKIHDRMYCGLSWEKINEHGGINISKLMAYLALQSSATDEWNFPIEKCIVVKDFEAPVTDVMDYISPDYHITRGIREVTINHCDGAGMALPGVLPAANTQYRGPFLKGLLTTFDFLRFCDEHKIKPVATDVWGQEHDLIAEDIQIIFTESQHKLWKYYDSWKQYCDYFNEYGCHLCITNPEEDFIKDTEICYQMLQSINMTDDEIDAFTRKTHQRIENMACNKDAMLQTLRANEDSRDFYNQAIYLYNELLNDAQAKETLKAIKKRMTLDAKSGSIRCKNKRLFALPDMYAFCERLFLNIEKPEGLLKNGEVFSRLHLQYDEADILRSPHLYREHAVRKFNKSRECLKWFTTNGIYTSVHDLITRILQLDVDGDQLNVVVDSIIVQAAKRNVEKDDIVPLFYDAQKAKPEIVSKGGLFAGVKRAHDCSGIGEVSNMLTKLWNKPNPSLKAAAMLCSYNNSVIDGAKTGAINTYENYPEAKKIVNSAVGGKTSKLPFFFQFTKNGRREYNIGRKYAKINDSTMNRICKKFDDIGLINFAKANVAPFNYEMLLSEPAKIIDGKVVDNFCEILEEQTNALAKVELIDYIDEKICVKNNDAIVENVKEELICRCGSLEVMYPSLVLFLFRDRLDKQTYKQMFWKIFGHIAVRNLQKNMQNFTTCENCGMKIPKWSSEKDHHCPKVMKGFFRCIDCGKIEKRTNSRQTRCEKCFAEYRKIYMANLQKERRRKQCSIS